MADEPLSEAARKEVRKTIDEMSVTVEKLASLGHPADGPYIECLRDLLVTLNEYLVEERPHAQRS